MGEDYARRAAQGGAVAGARTRHSSPGRSSPFSPAGGDAPDVCAWPGRSSPVPACVAEAKLARSLLFVAGAELARARLRGRGEARPRHTAINHLSLLPSVGEMNASCAKPMGFSGGVMCQRRARVRVLAVAAAPERVTMYDVLAVGKVAGPEEIKAVYMRAARRWHPDACPVGADRFMRAREAYEVLSDPERRRGYEIQLRCGAGAAGSRPAPPAGFADWEAQLAGLQWRMADTRGSRMRRGTAQPTPF